MTPATKNVRCPFAEARNECSVFTGYCDREECKLWRRLVSDRREINKLYKEIVRLNENLDKEVKKDKTTH